MKKAIFVSLAFLATNPALTVRADEFEQIEVLDKPRYTLKDKLTLDLDLTFLPLDAYYKPIVLEGALSYQFNDWFQLEAVRFGWSIHNYDTGFTASLQSIAPAGYRIDNQQKDFRYKVGSAGYFNILYSKSNFFNSAVAYHYWQIGGGITYYDMDDVSQLGMDIIMRVRFFLGENTTLNVRGGHTIGFKTDAPKNITFIGLGLGYAF